MKKQFKKILKKVLEIFSDLKDNLILMDKKVLIIIGGVVLLILLVILLVIFTPRTLKCEQTVKNEGIINTNMIEIKYRKDTIKQIKTIYNYQAKTDKDKKDINQIKLAMENIAKVYKNMDGVVFTKTVDRVKVYQAEQIINFKEISDENLANIGIAHSYKQVRKNYEGSGFTCK
ncbi:MAG: hypothetical protein RSB72_03050 [Bacilli bacterium]